LAQAILHIGLEKTGTSSLQEFLQLNRELLRQRENIWIPDFLGRGSQWPLAVIAYDPVRSDDLTAPLGEPEARACRIAEIRGQITAAVQQNAARAHCFSSEHLSSRLTTPQELERLRAFLQPLFDSITIVLYLREPIRLAISRQSTFVKMGLGGFQLPTPHQLAEGFDYRAVIDLWQAAFPGSLQVRRFDPSQPGFDLIADFCAAVGISAVEACTRPPRVNESLDWTVMRLLSRINRIAIDELGGPLPRPVLERLVPLLERLAQAPGRPRSGYVPTAEAVTAYRAFFADQERWLLERFFPDRDALWCRPCSSPTTEEERAAASRSLEVSDAEEILCRVIVDLAAPRAVPVPELIHCLEQIAWKDEQGQPLNLYDRETCRSLARTLRRL
jgi:hypothetical protein